MPPDTHAETTLAPRQSPLRALTAGVVQRLGRRAPSETTAKEPTDEELVALIARGEESALEALYERYCGRVFSLLLRTVADRHAAEELTQEAFVRVWRRAGSYRAERGRVGSWLLGVAHHLGVDELRRRGARPQPARGNAESTCPLARESDSAPGPEEVAITQARRGYVAEALAHLPDTQRTMLELAYFSGLTQAEIAERTDQPLGTVKTRTRRALASMRTHLEAQGISLDTA